MSFLGNLRVRVKIVAGYVIVLLLMVVIGVVALWGATVIQSTVRNLADNLAAEQHLADEIVSQIWTLRLFAQRYIRQQDPDDLTRFNEELTQFNDLLSQADTRIVDRERLRLLTEIQSGSENYGDAFYQTVNLLDEWNTIVQGTLEVQGSLADLRLERLRESIFEDGNAEASYYAGNAQRAYLKIRINTFRYLDTGEAGWISERRHQDALNAFEALIESLDDPAQRAMAEEAEAAVIAYIQGVSLVQDNFVQQQQLVVDMSALGPEIATAGDEMSSSVAADFQAVNEETRVLINRARSVVLAVMVFAILVGLGFGLTISHNITQPINALMQAVRSVTAGNLDQRAPVMTDDEVGELSRSFNQMTETIKDQTKSLQESVKVTERRTRSLEFSAEVSRAVTSILDPNELIQEVVRLIRERFNLYYVGLFLVDETGDWAVLQAGTGEAGRAMLARGHRLEIGGDSMIGWSIFHSQARIAQVAEEDAVRLATAELPDTRSEAALPLRSRGRVLGALSVQSDQYGVFDEAMLTVLQTMTDQIAVALDNARLFTEAQAAIEAERRAYGEVGAEAWISMIAARAIRGYFCGEGGIRAVREPIELSSATSETGELKVFTIPIESRGQVLGTLQARKSGEWTSDEEALLKNLRDQLGGALESARLYEDTQRRAARERLVGEITSHIRESLEIDTVLKTAVQEMRRALAVPELTIRLANEPEGGEGEDLPPASS